MPIFSRLALVMTGQDVRSRGHDVVLPSIRRRELVSAVGTDRIARRYQAAALGALLHGRLTTSATLSIVDANRVQRPVPQDVSPEIQDQAICFSFEHAESASHHLVVETGGERRADHRHAVNVRRVVARGQHVHIDQILQLSRLEP